MADVMSEREKTQEDAAAPSGQKEITAERYLSRDMLDKEWEHLWPRTWLYAGVASDVSEPGEYFVFNIGPESILVSHTDEGEISAFYNACQHRGARIMVNERGWIKNFVCPYHGWTYSRDGALTVVPDENRFSQGIDCDKQSLIPVRTEIWAGLVWICMDEDAPPFDEYIGPLKEQIDPYRLDDMVLAQDQTVHLECNWKAVFDNFGELYHVEHIHPQHALIFDCPTSRVRLWKHGHTSVYIDGFTVNTRLPIPEEPTKLMKSQLLSLGMDPEEYRGRVLDIRKDVQKKRRDMGPALGYNYDLLSDEELSDIFQHNIFPNMLITLQPDKALIMRARPHHSDPSKCYWDKVTLVMPPSENAEIVADLQFMPKPKPIPDERPEREEFTQEDVIAGEKTMDITVDQDVHLIRDVQNGMRSRGFSKQVLNDDEARIQHYHDWYSCFMEL